MNKEEYIRNILEWATKEKVPLSEIGVSHGGSMLLMGLRDRTNDIDMNVSKAVWDKFVAKKIYKPVDLGGGVQLMSVTPVIDIHFGVVRNKVYLDDITPEGVRYHSLRQTYLDYLFLNRPKDQESIKLLAKVIKKQFPNDPLPKL